MNPLKALEDYGQSVWLDYFRRSLVSSGELKPLIDEDGLKGLTSNPSIFEKAIGGSTDYDVPISALERGGDIDPGAIFERLAVEDMQMAADALRPVYQATGGRDGFASIEVSPYLAKDAETTMAEARRLWRAIRRENLMIKVPATEAGLPAIRRLTSEGVNINITLLFSRKVYEAVAEAYIERLWRRDASLWTGADEGQWLGWLGIADDCLAHLAPLEALAEEVKSEGFTDIVLLGMGGSSLGAEMLAESLKPAPSRPSLRVLDSTDPVGGQCLVLGEGCRREVEEPGRDDAAAPPDFGDVPPD